MAISAFCLGHSSLRLAARLTAFRRPSSDRVQACQSGADPTDRVQAALLSGRVSAPRRCVRARPPGALGPLGAAPAFASRRPPLQPSGEARRLLQAG